MSNQHGSGRRRRGAAAGARARKRNQRPQENNERPSTGAPDAPVSLNATEAKLAALPDPATSPRDTDVDHAEAGTSLPQRVPSATLAEWDRTLVLDDAVDPYLRAMRNDLREVLGLVPPPVHPQTVDTAVLPVITDTTAVLPVATEETAVLDTIPAAAAAPVAERIPPRPAPQLVAPVPSGAPVGPAIPSRYQIEPPASGAANAQVTALWTAPPVATTRELPRIPAPHVPPPAPVPVTPWLLRKIFGEPWSRVLELWRAEVLRFGPGRIAAIHHVPTIEGAIATAALYGFSRTPLFWDGKQYVGGEPREGRMHPTIVMHGLTLHVRDHRDPERTADPIGEPAGSDEHDDVAARQVAV